MLLLSRPEALLHEINGGARFRPWTEGFQLVRICLLKGFDIYLARQKTSNVSRSSEFQGVLVYSVSQTTAESKLTRDIDFATRLRQQKCLGIIAKEQSLSGKGDNMTYTSKASMTPISHFRK